MAVADLEFKKWTRKEWRRLIELGVLGPDDRVEVALSSLRKDRIRKASLYARAQRPEYWIVNLDETVVEVYRDPVRDGRGFYDGWSYGTVRRLTKGDAISPLALPGVEIAVADLLP